MLNARIILEIRTTLPHSTPHAPQPRTSIPRPTCRRGSRQLMGCGRHRRRRRRFLRPHERGYAALQARRCRQRGRDPPVAGHLGRCCSGLLRAAKQHQACIQRARVRSSLPLSDFAAGIVCWPSNFQAACSMLKVFGNLALWCGDLLAMRLCVVCAAVRGLRYSLAKQAWRVCCSFCLCHVAVPRSAWLHGHGARGWHLVSR